jgi:hypothetical protein
VKLKSPALQSSSRETSDGSKAIRCRHHESIFGPAGIDGVDFLRRLPGRSHGVQNSRGGRRDERDRAEIARWMLSACANTASQSPGGDASRTGHPSFVMSASFSNQTLAQIKLWTNGKAYENDAYTPPKKLDEKFAELRLGKLGAKLTELSSDPAAYIGVTPEGPYKPECYRY